MAKASDGHSGFMSETWREMTARIEGENMIVGMSAPAFTQLHVIVSLIGIVSGLVVVWGMWRGRRPGAWTATFLGATFLTCVSGFFFHSKAIGPPHVLGVLSLIVLALAIYALRTKSLVRHWRIVYIVSSVAALYFNVFVGVVQAFAKIQLLHALAPTGSEPPFVVVQLGVLAIFICSGVLAAKRFRPPSPPFTASA